MLDVAAAFSTREVIKQLPNAAPQRLHTAQRLSSQQRFELRKDLLNGVQIRICRAASSAAHKQRCWCASDPVERGLGSAGPWGRARAWASCSLWPMFRPERPGARFASGLSVHSRRCAQPLRRLAPAHWHGVSFFKAQTDAPERFVHRAQRYPHAVLALRPLAQLRQRLIGMLGHLAGKRLAQLRQAQRHMVALHTGRVLAQATAAGAHPGHIRLNRPVF